jgi:thiamine biosynthesis protein ThiS
MNSSAANPIQITVNGQARSVPEGLKLPDLLEILGVDPSRVAIERNREIIRRPGWPSTPILAGDELEVVWFVGGGAR